jgi:hypothetical protein
MNDDINSQIAGLQRQVFALLIALVVVSGTITVYLYWQSRVAGYDIQALSRQTEKIFASYGQNKALIESFEKQLVAYGQTHPEFRPILVKYGLMPAPAQPAQAAPAAQPVPAKP